MTAPGDAPPVIIDGGDRTCAALLLELRADLTGLADGTVIHLIAHAPAAPAGLAAWCHLTGHACLGPVPGPPGQPVSALCVSPGSRPAGPGSPWRLAR
jgi:tRNA 2-thiouridine synthesizing protein A